MHSKNAKIEEENDIVRAKNGVPKHRLLDAKPSEFETFDQFCPGCELELKALPTFEAKLYLDLFVTQSGDMEEKFIPGVMFFTGWSLTRRLGPQWQTYIETQQKQIAALEKELKESDYPYVHGMSDKAQIADVKLNIRGNPHAMGEIVAARISQPCSVLPASRPTPMAAADWSLLLTSRNIRSPRASSSIGSGNGISAQAL